MGFSLGEILLLIVVGIIVVGPKRLPAVMRTAGQWIAKLRRMSSDLRSQSGIDDILRQEGLQEHLHELRSLSSLSRMNVMQTLMTPGAPAGTGAAAGVARTSDVDTPAPGFNLSDLRPIKRTPREPVREREYPVVGCDAHGAIPDDAAMYLPPPKRRDAAPVDALTPAPESVEPKAAEPEAAPPARAPDAAPADAIEART